MKAIILNSYNFAWLLVIDLRDAILVFTICDLLRPINENLITDKSAVLTT